MNSRDNKLSMYITCIQHGEGHDKCCYYVNKVKVVLSVTWCSFSFTAPCAVLSSHTTLDLLLAQSLCILLCLEIKDLSVEDKNDVCFGAERKMGVFSICVIHMESEMW